jgi:2-polyprenyl-6-hydroxyphenyl methylase/3-demethylubiquinone-9 3-methyltransferase
MLLHITKERCDYIQSCIERAFGNGALSEQEILEIGCGGGLICQELAQRGAIVFGIDPSKEALETARTYTEQAGVGQSVSFLQGHAEQLPYADGSFSVILCLDVLEHVQNVQATLREIARVLAPGGVFIFDTINRTWLARLLLIWIGERIPNVSLVPGLHSYTAFIKPHELHAFLTQDGLQVREMVGFMPRGFKQGRIIMGPGPFMGVSYVGYARKPL